MMQDAINRCAGRTEELLLMIDGTLAPPARASLERHLAGCPACERLAARLQSLDTALASRLSATVLNDAFDRPVLARLEALPQHDPASAAERRVRAERVRTAALADLRASARRALGSGLLDIAGVGALLWAGGRLVPRLLESVGQYAATLPAVSGLVTAVAVASLALAAACLVAGVERLGRAT